MKIAAPPRYLVLERVFLRPAVRPCLAGTPSREFEAGEEVDFNGPALDQLQPLNDPARQAKAVAIGRWWSSSTAPRNRQKLIAARSLGTGEPRDAADAERMIREFLAAWLPAADSQAERAA